MKTMLLTLLLLPIWQAKAQTTTGASLKFLFAGQEDTYPNPPITVNTPNLDRIYRTAVRVCVSGKWIFYTKENYGIGYENAVVGEIKATPVPSGQPGKATGDCKNLTSLGITMASIRSVRIISGPTGTINALSVFSENNYLGMLKPIGAAATTEIRLGSFIFSRGTANTVWELCASNDCITGDSVCADPQYFNPGHSVSDAVNDNTTINLDRPDEPVRWPRIIRGIRVIPNLGGCRPSSQIVGSDNARSTYYLKMKLRSNKISK